MTMHLDRRDFLKAGTAFTVATGLPPFAAAAQAAFTPQPGVWRHFEVVTRLEIAKPEGETQAWVPLPSVNEKDWFRSIGNHWTTNGHAARMRDPKYDAEILHIEWPAGEKAPAVEVISRISAQDRSVNLSKPGDPSIRLGAAERSLHTAGTELIPVDGIVKETADKIIGGKASEVEKVRAIYEWVVENTFRNAQVRGCGVGDVASMLKSGNLGGKCADLNALFVGLVRAAGIPARDIYGIRVAASKFGYKSLGAATEIITRAQHCRAEVFLSGYGWVATDPADVRKVVLEEPPTNLPIDDPKVVAARQTLFGAWEGNWLAYNFAHDIALPGSTGPKLGFLMYPQAEVAGLRLDCLEPDTFKYTIKSKELTAA
jgi:transglutaminase-like putative cysteine protease